MRSRFAGCAEARACFSPAHDGVLEPDLETAFAAHLAGCAACRAARAAYDREVGSFGPLLRDAVAGEHPLRPFPESRPSALAGLGRRWKPLALGLSALAAGFLALGPHADRVAVRGGEAFPPRPRPCPWHRAAPEELGREVSYPVVAQPCLDSRFELVEARVGRGSSCGERVVLTYRSGARTLTLEQRPEGGAGCPAEHVLAGETQDCWEAGEAGAERALVWSQAGRGFRLAGDLAPVEAVAMARAISADLDAR